MSEIRNGRNKVEIISYLDTSPTTAPKSDEHHYCNKNSTTPGATNFTLSTRGSYKLGGDSAICTSKSEGASSCHYSSGERP